MKSLIKKIIGLSITLLVVALAFFGGERLWKIYNLDPWTRDGRVRADVVLVSPDVNGLVTSVDVRDGQKVRTGDTLFVIDRARYELALEQANATIAAEEAELAQAERDVRRNRELGNLVTTEQFEQSNTKVQDLRAQIDGARVARDTAKLNLDRTIIKATVNGIVTNLDLQPGDYATVGRQVLALVDSDSIHVDGYFEETKLPAIRVGDRAIVQLMGVETDLHGVVEDVAAGIEDRERNASSNSLANVNPTFSWVRLAQRVPVRIRLINVPADIRLIAGRTATVSIVVPKGRRQEGAKQ
ncbi:MAG TPA: efflux RND transporter periplasmic adaptor subunit [Rhizomicrobium sp.]|jgi:RND family efflux transporter MFP subunit|nr:efflux RND transporter periplasmic adaptor subunit [Rhizomicrobium sp.]